MRMHLGLFPGRALSEGSAPPPPAWTPANTTTLLWLDNVDTSVVTLGTGISQWNEKSGGNKHVAQAVGSLQPTLIPARLNGLSGVRFNQGLGQHLINTAGAITINRYTLVTLWEQIGNLGGTIVKNGAIPNDGLNSGTSVGTGGTTYDDSGSNVIVLREWMEWMPSTQQTPLGNPAIITAKMLAMPNNNGNVGAQVSVNSSNLVNITQTQPPAPNAGLQFAVGSATDGTRPADAYLYEMVVLPWDVSDDILHRTQGYLAWRYGTQNNLNAGHPYRSARPN